MKEFTFRKLVDLQPTTLPKMSSFKVFFFSGLFPLFYFSLGTLTLWNTFEWLLPNFCFIRLFNINKKKLVSRNFLSYFKSLILGTSIIFFSLEILSPEWREIHKFITQSFLKTGLLILVFKMWHIWPYFSRPWSRHEPRYTKYKMCLSIPNT